MATSACFQIVVTSYTNRVTMLKNELRALNRNQKCEEEDEQSTFSNTHAENFEQLRKLTLLRGIYKAQLTHNPDMFTEYREVESARLSLQLEMSINQRIHDETLVAIHNKADTKRAALNMQLQDATLQLLHIMTHYMNIFEREQS